MQLPLIEIVFLPGKRSGIQRDALLHSLEVWPQHRGSVISFQTVSGREKNFFFNIRNTHYLHNS